MWVKPPRNARGSIFECAPELPGRGFAKCGRTFRRVFNEFVPYPADKRNQFADARPARRDERTVSLGATKLRQNARARHHETKLTYAASLANSRSPELRALALQFFPFRVKGKRKKKGLRLHGLARAISGDFEKTSSPRDERSFISFRCAAGVRLLLFFFSSYSARRRWVPKRYVQR